MRSQRQTVPAPVVAEPEYGSGEASEDDPADGEVVLEEEEELSAAGAEKVIPAGYFS
jgi:hypothetical protein